MSCKIGGKMEKTLYQKLAEIKLELSKAQIKKSGVNKYSGFTYYELADILPAIISLCSKYGVYTYTSYDNDMAKLTAVNTNNPTEQFSITSPMRTFELKGSNAIQVLGGIETYSRRYLYLAMFDIVESDSFDANAGSDKNIEIKKEVKQEKVLDPKPKTENVEFATKEQIGMLKSLGYKGQTPAEALTKDEADRYIKMGLVMKGKKGAK